MKISHVVIGLFLSASSALAQDVLILGEIHDNPTHHITQSERVQAFKPAAIVFEMLTPLQASQYTPGLRDDARALAQALEWENSGWPDFEIYYPIFAVAGEARIYGAGVPRKEGRQAMQEGIDAVFPEAKRFGLTAPLSEDQQIQREALQHAAHCDALPAEMLPVMVEIQRLRDAVLARAVLTALDDTGGPVAVITGNGHARKDWGASAVLADLAPDLQIYVLGQTEEGAMLNGGFDEVISASAIEREDPCAAFQ
ncbi:ChaN family lipoprotein [Roseovarius sp. EL26]|uniref:ChaN family lipoprotein n=1 Tax=Roseovarius sp. EL26 TaxID=2126672 RepID=UPI000EA3B4F3|nr:ChaN family lipoprotein [Roseovarius sp. EL26]